MSEPMTVSAEGAESAQEQERGYWLYTPGEGAARWEEFRTAGIMALNWDRIGDPTSYPNEEAVIEALEAGYGDWGGRPTGAAGMIRDFTYTMRPGDVVYARRGPTEIIGRGVVRSEFRYDNARPAYRCVRDIEWTHVGSWPLDRRVGAVTLQRVTENTSYNPAQLESLFRDRNASGASTASAQAQGVGDSDKAKKQELQHWLYTPGEGAARWEEFRTAGIMALNWDRVGDLASFPDKESLLDALYTHYGDWGGRPRRAADSVWDYIHAMKPGDIVYVRRSFNEIVGRGVVRSDYRYDEDRSSFRAVRDVEWTHIGSWPLEQRIGRLMLQRLTENTKYTPDQLNALIGIEDPRSSSSVDKRLGNNDLDEADEHYTSTDFLDEVFLSPEDLEQMLGLLRRKKNLILQGAPGTGKTFAAKRLAYALMGETDDSRVEVVQFHQSTAYEDVVVGLRPTAEGGFAAAEGVFARFCRRAAADPGRDYVFIIDEINRANISKAFGELLMLIEAEHRGEALRLPVSGELLSVPKRLHIIGMMNTADRGLALIDYALRRRFAFFEIRPALDHPGFLRHVEAVGSSRLEALVDVVRRLNQRIAEDEALGPGFQIGHSYLCLPAGNPENPGGTDADVTSMVRYELEPLVREYWFDNPAAMDESIHELESILP
ncbi:McrB family protein [Actinomyces naeslundii]|uniref:AAA family ATPase n=1 Tax=Actinomyces naeslundii TaxID=1655 RepID=A0AA47FGI1_ACTNA|nr:AAA family ATPase [Actinomyces naeslundii]OMG16144.1 restriction endonuclease [Actinomyces naeslundii]PKY94175.1 restriction endonuclease [Actinomyces naeslundii]WAL42836.1 AAA family ATPase [Actinomyces naeslundii]